MKKKKILLWVLIPLISALLIAGIVIGTVMSCAPKSDGTNTPVEPGPEDPPVVDPPVVDPPHVHKWVWTYTPSEHYQYCTDDFETRNRGPHEYSNNEDNICNVCEYERKMPTKQDKIEVEFDEDGNAKIGGLKDSTVTDLVISGTVTDPSGKEVDVVEISEGAFQANNGLKSVTVLEGIKIIGKNAFLNCSELESVWLPKTVELIDPEAFRNCKSLKTIIIDIENPHYMGVYNCIIRIADKCLIIGCNGSEIPTRSDSSGYIVTSIGDGAFYGSGIAEIVIPSNITKIGAHAFQNCTSLAKFTCLDGVTQIPDNTFKDCTALNTLILSDGITEIGANAFDGCTSLENITLPTDLAIIREYAFRGCSSLENVTLNEGLVTIAGSAFRSCTSLESITLPSTIRGIGTGAFAGCTHLTSIIYAGTEDEWQENVRTASGWKPDGVEVTFTQPDEENPDIGDSGNTDSGNGDDNGGSENSGTDN